MAMLPTVRDWLVPVLLGGWALVSCVAQIRHPAVQRLRRWDALNLIPMWWFFAPHPPRGDFHLLYRDELRDGTMTPWTEVRSGAPRRAWNFVWNPTRRKRKALFDVTSALASEALRCGTTAAQVSVPYLLLLNHVTSRQHASDAVNTQFLVMCSEDPAQPGEPVPMFLSPLHGLTE